MSGKLAKEIMTSEVKVVKRTDKISEAVKVLTQEKVGGLPVVNDENKVIGIISETDVLKKEKNIETPAYINLLQGIFYIDTLKTFEKDIKSVAAYIVEDLMSTKIITVDENDTLKTVANLMINKNINRVPVVDKDKKLKGIICRYDVIKAMYADK